MDVLEADHFEVHSQPTAPSHTLPLPKNKSGIRVTRIPAPLMSLITAPPQTPIDIPDPVTAPPLAPINIPDPVIAPPLAPIDIPDSVTAPIDFGIHNEPTDAPALTLAQAAEIDRPSTSAQADRVAPSTSAQADRVASTHDVEILDFSDIIPDLPKNVFTEFYDIFPVVQPNRNNCTVEELNKNKNKELKYRKRKWEQFGRIKNPQERKKAVTAAQAKAVKQGYILADDGVTQFTIKAYHGVKRGYFGRVYQVAVEFTDNVLRWVNSEELIHAKDSLNEYFNKLNQPNPEINPKGIKLGVPESVFEKKKN